MNCDNCLIMISRVLLGPIAQTFLLTIFVRNPAWKPSPAFSEEIYHIWCQWFGTVHGRHFCSFELQHPCIPSPGAGCPGWWCVVSVQLSLYLVVRSPLWQNNLPSQHTVLQILVYVSLNSHRWLQEQSHVYESICPASLYNLTGCVLGYQFHCTRIWGTSGPQSSSPG